MGALLFRADGLGLLRCSFDSAPKFCQAGPKAFMRVSGFLRLALQAALLFTAFGDLALTFDHTFVQLGMALLAVGQLHVQLFKTCFGGDATLLQVVQLPHHFAQVGVDLLAAGTGLFGELGQAQCLDLQRVGLGLCFGGLTARRHQTLGRVGIRRLGAHQGGA